MSDHRAPQQSRRLFVAGASIGLLALQYRRAIAQPAANAQTASAGDLVIRSSPGLFSHTHDLLISGAYLRTPPPRGVRIVSTTALFHTHEFLLTRDQLRAIERGEPVTTTASSHTFVIALAQGINERESALQMSGRHT
jgi:hypothetical protein